jgi:hypothetical protein
VSVYNNDNCNKDEDDQKINEIKTNFLSATDFDVETRKDAFDTLGYDDKGILSIKDLIGSTQNNDIKGYGFQVIARTKKKHS